MGHRYVLSELRPGSSANRCIQTCRTTPSVTWPRSTLTHSSAAQPLRQSRPVNIDLQAIWQLLILARQTDELVAYYRPNPKGLTCSDSVPAPTGFTYPDDSVFVIAMLTGAGTVVITSGSNAPVSINVPAGVTTVSAPMGVGVQSFELQRSGASVFLRSRQRGNQQHLYCKSQHRVCAIPFSDWRLFSGLQLQLRCQCLHLICFRIHLAEDLCRSISYLHHLHPLQSPSEDFLHLTHNRTAFVSNNHIPCCYFRI